MARNKRTTINEAPAQEIRIITEAGPKYFRRIKKAVKWAGALGVSLALVAVAADRTGFIDAGKALKKGAERVEEAFREPPNKVKIEDAETVWRALQGEIEYRKTIGAGYCPPERPGGTERICPEEGLKIKYDNPRVDWLPSWAAGTRADINVVGRVHAAVSLNGLVSGAVRPNGDNSGLVIELPRSRMLETYVDPENSSFDATPGVVNEVFNLRTGEKRMRVCAEKSLTQNALSQDLLRQTETEAALMVKQLATGILIARNIPVTENLISVRYMDESAQIGTGVYGPLPSEAAIPAPTGAVPKECLR